MRDVNLTHKDSVIAFEFAALDYSAPHKNHYMYKLEGFDDEVGRPRHPAPGDLHQSGLWDSTAFAFEPRTTMACGTTKV